MHPALLALIFLLALLGHGYLWIGIVNRLHGWAGPHRIIDLLTLTGLLIFLTLPLVVLWQWWPHGTTFLANRSMPLVGKFSQTYVLTTAFFGLGNLLAKIVGGWNENDPQAVIFKSREYVKTPEFISHKLLVGIYPRLLGLVPGNQVLQLAVDTKRIALSGLPVRLAGLRIVHISDFHLTGRIREDWFTHVVETVNSLGADAVVITGDLIEKESCRAWLRVLGRLRSKHGVYFVLGNHDYYVDVDRTIADLTAAGFIYVGGKSLLAEWNGYPVLIAGNELPWSRQLADLTKVESHGVRPFRLLLMHTPDQFDWACLSHADLALAGHTHGGQVCFPILGAVASPSQYGTRFAGGTFKRGKTVLHVTRGISGETPMRWLCPPEIAVLELTSAKSAS